MVWCLREGWKGSDLSQELQNRGVITQKHDFQGLEEGRASLQSSGYRTLCYPTTGLTQTGLSLEHHDRAHVAGPRQSHTVRTAMSTEPYYLRRRDLHKHIYWTRSYDTVQAKERVWC